MLHGCGEGFARVDGLGCGEPHEFGSAEGEGRGDEDGTEAFEAVVEGAGVEPVLAADVAAVGAASDVEDDSEDAI